MLDLSTIREGESLPAVVKPPISRTTLALFAGGSGDHNPIHIDIDYAKQAGFDDVFAHGMLSMAYLGQVLTNWAPQKALRSYSVRFRAITHVGDEISCSGRVSEVFQENNEPRVRIELTAANQDGDVKLISEAVIAVS